LKNIQVEIRSGSKEVYDAAMEAYFDSIPHDKLIKCVERRITDGSIIKLIRQWLKAIVMEEPRDGGGPTYKRSKCGTPQGGVISPLLANLYLHFFDLILTREYPLGHSLNIRLIRYADDFVILGKRIDASLIEFVEKTLEGRMGLKINRAKTQVRSLCSKGDNLNFLGYVYRKEKAKQWEGYYNNMLPAPKSLKRIKEKIRDLTSSSRSFVPSIVVVEQVSKLLEGWSQYFSLGFCAPAYSAIDSYTHYRLVKHLNRRSQKGYRKPKDVTWGQYLERLGLRRLSTKLRPSVGLR
jgi:RNA-directed DNA polymerase